MTLRIGSLCSGYGGLDLAVEAVTGATTAWFCEYDRDPSAILAHHWPHVPNHGDVKNTDWSQVEPVDILTAGYPCQPFSHAGKRKGHNDPRHLWPDVARAIRVLRPRLAVLENVRGHVSLGLADVLGDLSRMGYDARWGVVRAAEVGAPHGRARIFIVASPHGYSERWGAAGITAPRQANGRRAPSDAERRGGARPVADTASAGLEGRDVAALQPPPGVDGLCAACGVLAPADSGRERHGCGEDAGGLGRVDGADAGEAREREWARGVAVDRGAEAPCTGVHDNGAASCTGGHGPAPDADRGGCAGCSECDCEAPAGLEAPRGDDAHGRVLDRWGAYGPAIARWELVLGRPAPDPTEPGRNGRPRLSPVFVEWLMGLDPGHVTDPAIGLSRNAQLKALGNGVVPQQAALALRLLLTDRQETTA